MKDFDDWDDVGLNTAKPPGLRQLYLYQGQVTPQPVVQASVSDAECMTFGDFNQDQLEVTIQELQSERHQLVCCASSRCS